MGNLLAALAFSSVTIFDVEIRLEYLVFAAILVVCGCCCLIRGKSEKPTAGESFIWPNSSRFLKRVDPARPPPLNNSKYEDPVRTDVIPLNEETFWVVRYQPSGERNEVTHRMYLRFKLGKVYGIGYEDARRLCKIKGKYKLNASTNQIGLALECNFSNECDTVLFHGWGNGTGIVGNCYIREINPFSMLSLCGRSAGSRFLLSSTPLLRSLASSSLLFASPSLEETSPVQPSVPPTLPPVPFSPRGVPVVRRLSKEKYKGSFLMLKSAGMGEASLRARLHMNQVHEWAGKCFPDDSVPLPRSPLQASGSTPRSSSGQGRGARYVPVKDSVDSRGRRASGSKKSIGAGKKFRRFFQQRRPSAQFGEQDRPSVSSRAGTADEFPPWVRGGSGGGDDNEGYLYPSSPRAGRAVRPQTIDTTNYLELEGVPGRSGDLV